MQEQVLLASGHCQQKRSNEVKKAIKKRLQTLGGRLAAPECSTAYTVMRGDCSPASATPQTQELAVSEPTQSLQHKRSARALSCSFKHG